MADRGAVLDERLSIEELELDPPGPGEVCVRLTASGVCRSDLHIVETGGWGHPLPVLLGHEGAGVVDSVGEGVEELAARDPVVLAWRSPCGRCQPCLRGDPRRCRTPVRARRRIHRASDGALLSQALLCGTFATRTVVDARAAIPVPPQLAPERACLLGCAVATGVCAVLTTPIWPGARVAVIGCGGVGLSVVQGARVAGAAEIVAVDVSAERLAKAGELGATSLVHARDADSVEADFVYDVVGSPQTIEQAVRMLAYAGTVTLIGIGNAGERTSLEFFHDTDGLFAKRGTIRISYGGDHLPAEDFPRLAQLALDGQLDLDAMVTDEIALDDVEGALRTLGTGNSVRSVIRF